MTWAVVERIVPLVFRVAALWTGALDLCLRFTILGGWAGAELAAPSATASRAGSSTLGAEAGRECRAAPANRDSWASVERTSLDGVKRKWAAVLLVP